MPTRDTTFPPAKVKRIWNYKFSNTPPADGEVYVWNETSSKFEPGQAPIGDLADNSVTTPKIADLNVTTSKLNDLAVTTAKLNDQSVTTAKLADANVTAAKMAASSIATASYIDNSITTAKIIDLAVTTNKIDTSAVTSDKIASGAVTLSKEATRPRVRAYRSTNQTIPNNTATSLLLTAERWDSDGEHSTSSNTSRFTIVTAGVYVMTTHIAWDNNGTGTRLVNFQLNGATDIGASRLPGLATANQQMSVATVFYFSAGDYVEVVVKQDSGGNLDVVAADDYGCEFSMALIGI